MDEKRKAFGADWKRTAMQSCGKSHEREQGDEASMALNASDLTWKADTTLGCWIKTMTMTAHSPLE